MNPSREILFKLRANKLFMLMMGFSLTYFLYKGVAYAIIGSYWPLTFILVLLGLFVFGTYRSAKAFRRVVSFWSVLITIWATLRLLLAAINQFIKPVPEGHVDGQLGLAGSILSLLFLIAGIYLLATRKTAITD